MLSSLSELDQNQLAFIQRTYTILFGSLLLMTIIGIFSYHVLPPMLQFPVMILDFLIWVACGWFHWRNPIKAVFPIFLVITGLAMGQIAHLYSPNLFLSAALTTLAIFAGVSTYVFFSKCDFSFLAASLNIGFWILLVGGILTLFFHINILSLFLGFFGSAVFIGWILYDISQILIRAEQFGYDARFGAFDLFMDIIGLFSYIRSLFSYFDD